MNALVRFVIILSAGFGGGFAAQAYALPRIGLDRLELGEYCVLFSIYVVIHLAIELFGERK
jgi:hypothetical protein